MKEKAELGLRDTQIWIRATGLHITAQMIRRAEEHYGWISSRQRGPRSRKKYDVIQRQKMRYICLLRMLGRSTKEIADALHGDQILVKSDVVLQMEALYRTLRSLVIMVDKKQRTDGS